MINGRHNESFIDRLDAELPESTFYWLLIALIFFMLWVIYLTYYNSRILGIILSLILNKFVKYGHIRFGSFSVSVLSGKIMFRDVHLVTEDFSVRAQFGWIIFRWWRPYVFRELHEDLSHSDTRLSLYLDKFEFHVYNRSTEYATIEKLFGLSPQMLPKKEPPDKEKEQRGIQVPSKNFGWRDLVPVIKVNVETGRFVFGNHLIPTTLTVSFEGAHFIYTTKPASTPFDQFMHATKCKAENVRIMLVPSLKYTGPTDEPPRYMGEGFVVFQSNDVNMYYYQDEPGTVPHEPEIVHLADGEVVVRRTWPCSGIEISCGKGTDFNYGPWADRQREYLWKFFYPANYQELVPTPVPEPGMTRQFKQFEFRINILAEATIDFLFTKDKETQAIHMNSGQGSYIEAITPYLTGENGYQAKVNGQFLLLDATTSLQYRSLLECETLEFSVNVVYPRLWNDHQDWFVDITACKASLGLIFHHKHFIVDLFDDWSTKSVPDLYHFTPYTWHFNIVIKEFELLTMANEYNWIDTASQYQENGHIGICGETFDLSFQLPFIDFIPERLPIKVFIRSESADCRVYLPESNTSRATILSLAQHMKITDREGNILDKPFGHQEEKKWVRHCSPSCGWVTCWTTNIVALSIGYNYHPMPTLRKPADTQQEPPEFALPLTTPEEEEALLIPLRPIKPASSKLSLVPESFDASTIVPDLISVELEVGPSVLCLYGSLLRNFLHVKENYLGEDQKFSPFFTSPPTTVEEDTVSTFTLINPPEESDEVKPFDPRKYRPFAVTVSATFHDIQAHLIRNCSEQDPPCPSVHVERVGFEMDKSFLETKLQLLLSPAILIAKDNFTRPRDQGHLHQGHIGLSGLQVRGHAMFSHRGLPLESETLEYGWLVEATIGNITGKLTTPQIQNITEFLITFVMLVDDPENRLQHPVAFRQCQHMVPQHQCVKFAQYPFPCPSSEDIKYRMTRASIDSINLFVVESGSALNLELSPARVSTCNLHGPSTRAGITAVVEHIYLKQFISTAAMRPETDHNDTWLESGGISLGPVNLEAAMALPSPEFHSVQDEFLKYHDQKTKRLWLLWPVEVIGAPPKHYGKCGCQGGCEFFGKNRNGVGFFYPKRYTKDTIAKAVFQIFPVGTDPGFGQSLLHKDRLVFEVASTAIPESPNGKGFSFTRGYMSPETPMTNSTLLEDLKHGYTCSISSEQSILLSSRLQKDSVPSESESVDPRHQRHSCNSSVSTVSPGIPTEFLPEGPLPDPFDTDTVSSPTITTASSDSRSLQFSMGSSPTSSLPGGTRQAFERQVSSTPGSVSQKASPVTAERRDSRSSTLSFHSVNTNFDRSSSKQSLSSPLLGRLSSSNSLRLKSSTSVESEQYFSADEDMMMTPELERYNLLHTIPDADANETEDRDGTLVSRSTDVSRLSDFTVEGETVLDLGGSSSSLSSSTISYMSAGTTPTETGSQEVPEDFSLVDLHGQINQLITKSPILMSCYSSHLTQLQCQNWTAPPPLPYLLHRPGLKHDRSFQSHSSVSGHILSQPPSWIPHFVTARQGFTASSMKSRVEHQVSPNTPESEMSRPSWDMSSGSTIGSSTPVEEDDVSEVLPPENTSKTTAVVKIKESVDIMLTPLLLESIQRYVEAVIPALSILHPSSVIDFLHGRCLDKVKQQNTFKQGVQGEGDSPDEEEVPSSQDVEDEEVNKGGCEATRTSSLQALVSLSKINVCILQSSVVEEVISFSALDHIQELACVSMLAVCVDNISCQALLNDHSCKITHQHSRESSIRKLSGSLLPRKSKSGGMDPQPQAEVECEKVVEVLREEALGKLHIGRIHCQLRRLFKASTCSDKVFITAIPEQKSKVMFLFDKDSWGSVQAIPQSSPKRSRKMSNRDTKLLDQEDTKGLIMFECGIEDITLTAVRRLGYKDSTSQAFQEKMAEIERTLNEMQEKTNFEMENETQNPVGYRRSSSNSSRMNPSTDSVSSWDSKMSIPSSATSLPSIAHVEPLVGDASSLVLEFTEVWFNFASPPSLPRKRQADFTRLDWNLLSTATPAINAWLNPSDRMMVAVSELVRVVTQRTSSIMACIMTEGLEVQGIHMPYKSKFNKVTMLSKTLQEDPSCQLMNVLRKYLLRVGTDQVEEAVSADTTPQIITIQKGILALTRQWKNVLYMPQLAGMTFKTKKPVRPYSVKFAIPDEDGSTDFNVDEEDEGDILVSQYDVVDEKVSLLHAEGGSVHHSASMPSLNGRGGEAQKGSGINIDADGEETMPGKVKPAISDFQVMDSPNRAPSSSQKGFILTPHSILKRNGSNFSFISGGGSTSSLEQGGGITPPTTPLKLGASKHSILKKPEDQEDLYRWMARQQDGQQFTALSFHPALNNVASRQDSTMSGFMSNWSQDDSRNDLGSETYTLATSILQLADAQILFKPFLQSIGLHVEEVRSSAMMKRFGGNVSLQGSFNSLKIEIVESEQRNSGKAKGKGKAKMFPHMRKIFRDSPAFLCQKFNLNIGMKDVIDFDKNTNAGDNNKRSAHSLKFAMHKLEAKPATTQVNFLVDTESVTLNVDMSLLRLVHQFASMISNIQGTREELKQNRVTDIWTRTHRKQNSKDSTSSTSTQRSEPDQPALAKPNQHYAERRPVTPHSQSSFTEKPEQSKKQDKHSKRSASASKKNSDSKRPDKLTLTLKRKSDKTHKKKSSKATHEPSSPTLPNLNDSVTIDMVDSSSPVLAEKTIVDEIKETTPQCWRTLYHLLDLYSTMPEPKTVNKRCDTSRLSVIHEEPDQDSGRRADRIQMEEMELGREHPESLPDEDNMEGRLAQTTFNRTSFKQSIYIGESTPLVVYGVSKVKKVHILAALGGLKLEAELQNAHASGSYKEKVKGFPKRKSADSSVTTCVGHTMIVLKEGQPPRMLYRTVVNVDIGPCHSLYTSILRRAREHNSALVDIGIIDIKIPQHPVVLHGMMTRGSRQLSSTLQEFRWPVSRTSRSTVEADSNLMTSQPQEESLSEEANVRFHQAPGGKSQGFNMRVNATLQGCCIGAALLPSLTAEYKTEKITVSGITGKKAKFSVDLPSHKLSFQSKVTTKETSIPSSASVDLPPIHIAADYRHHKSNVTTAPNERLIEGLTIKEGSYLNAVAEVGMLELSLTTDLLNHLVFVQKVFMKELNELLQKMSGTEQPFASWAGEVKLTKENTPAILYSLLFTFKGIQITATTPTSSAVRLETGAIELEMSNRLKTPTSDTVESTSKAENQKTFIRAQVELNLALGQLLKNPLFEEAEPEFQTMAFFKTKIALRNALQAEMIPGQAEDQEALLIKLTRPIILAQPQSFDKAVLVWLNYRHAYEYWAEQRMALNKEVQRATQQVIDKLPQLAPTSAPAFSTLFLQLTVDDLGICVPAYTSTHGHQVANRLVESEPGAALVLTIENTQISACSSGSLVSKGKFTGFCLRFADDFETSWDDWKPDPRQSPIMNVCTVPEGTYEVCSRTISKQTPETNAKWILNILWQMQGIDVHFDANIGKWLSSLGSTLTVLAGQPDYTSEEELVHKDSMQNDEDDDDDDMQSYQTETISRRSAQVMESLPDFVYDTTIEPKQRVRLIETEMNEQARVVQDLKQLGASRSTVEMESRKLEELQNVIFNDFRRDVFNKIRKQSERASVLKDKLGLGHKPAHVRSRSVGHRRQRRVASEVKEAGLENTKDRGSHARAMSLDVSNITRTPSQKVHFRQRGSQSSSTTPSSIGSPDHLSTTIDDPTMMHTLWTLSDSPSSENAPTEIPPRRSASLHAAVSSSSESSLVADSEEDEDDIVILRHPQRRREVQGLLESTSEDGAGILSPPTVSNPSLGSISTTKSASEPNIDFELDVKVFIDSGKCVLHPNETLIKEEEVTKRPLRKERSFGLENSSSGSDRKQKKQDASGKKAPPLPLPSVETTVFLVPSVDVKVHYNSKTSPTDSSASQQSVAPGHASAMSSSDSELYQQESRDSGLTASTKKTPIKKANLYAWLSLQSLPEEMNIGPSLLNFLEQAFEPIPVSQSPHTAHKKVDVMGSVLNLDLDSSSASLMSSASYASFPVDVVVFIRVEPSIVRFNCLPVSRVECLLQVPSLELVFSTKRADVENLAAEGTPPTKPKVWKRPSRERSFSQPRPSSSDVRLRPVVNTDSVHQNYQGGLSFTGSLSDFSMYIFHPYGGGQRKVNPTSPGAGADSYKKYHLGSIQEHGTTASWSDLSRKDSLSLNVEFIKVNISRTRKLDVRPEGSSFTLGAFKTDKRAKCNTVRFSAICDIGSASFKYDMRRLSEILSFPKAWYRRNLARRMFLGDDSMTPGGPEEEWDSQSSGSSSLGPDFKLDGLFPKAYTSPALNTTQQDDTLVRPRRTHHRRVSSGDKIKIQVSPEFDKEIAQIRSKGGSAPQSPVLDGTLMDVFSPPPKPSTDKKRRGSVKSPEVQRQRSSQQSMSKSLSSWETLVLFAVNLSRLDVNVNMSNVMGNTVWSTKDLQCQGRLSIDSTGHKNMKITAGLGGSNLDSKGGIISGAIDLQELDAFFHVSEDPSIGKEPDHLAGISLVALEAKLDYMGSSVLMMRGNELQMKCKDEWKRDLRQEVDKPLATQRPAIIFVHADMFWDKFHIMISRSTTPDLLKMYSKLEEFLTLQFASSKRVLSAFGPMSSHSKTKVGPKRKLSMESELSDMYHHRHWQTVLEVVKGCTFKMLPSALPAKGTILGGTVSLQGNNLSLACFHGINFRAKSWAIFNMEELNICFAIEAQKVVEEEQTGTHIVQNLTFHIGHDVTQHTINSRMASILKLSRGQSMPPPFTNVPDWFNYAFASSHVKGVDSFPQVQKYHNDSAPEPKKTRKPPEYNHDTEIIFSLPSLQLTLKTDHFQGEREPGPEDPPAVVECSFVTEFENHILVAMDAEVLLFLHDLISSYIKEKERGGRASIVKSPDLDKKRVVDPTTALKCDLRKFVCNTWHLEPTVRLFHWASRQIDPVGVDYVLQKLGFTHAKETIPKWMQRGFNDPLDKILSILVNKLILILRENSPEDQLDEE